MLRRTLLIGSLAVLLGGVGLADEPGHSIYGTCVYKDGSKAGGAVSISTSWNGHKAYPANGRYVLQFDGKVNSSVTVNGTTFGRVYVSKPTRLDIVVPQAATWTAGGKSTVASTSLGRREAIRAVASSRSSVRKSRRSAACCR